MSKIRNHDKVRFVRGRTVDTEHVNGGSLKGCNGYVCSEVFEANGVDGPKGQKRVCVAVDDDKAPRFAGFITAPVENLEVRRSSNRRASASGIGRGRMSGTPGRSRYVVKNGRMVRKDARSSTKPRRERTR